MDRASTHAIRTASHALRAAGHDPIDSYPKVLRDELRRVAINFRDRGDEAIGEAVVARVEALKGDPVQLPPVPLAARICPTCGGRVE